MAQNEKEKDSGRLFHRGDVWVQMTSAVRTKYVVSCYKLQLLAVRGADDTISA